MAKKALSVVPPGARVAPPAKTIREAVDRSERELLIALRNKIASDIDKGVPPHTLAPLSRQLRDLDRDIRAIDAHEEGDEVGNAADTPDEEWAAT